MIALCGSWAHAALAATYAVQATPYAWETASTDVVWEQTNTAYPQDDDKQLVNIGFTFNYGGVGYTQVRIITNGALHFGADQNFHQAFNNTAFPIAAADRVIAPYWDDLDPGSGGTVRYSTLGSAPNRYFVVSWEGVPRYGGAGSYTFQAILYESGDIKFQYGPGSADGSSATIGVEVDNSDYTSFSVNAASVGNGTALLFHPPDAQALYSMEQASWSGAGAVLDGSGNGHAGTPVGGVQPQLPPTPTPPGTCIAANIPVNTSLNVFDAIDTGIDIDGTIGNRGTIGFWYRAGAAWNDGNSRMLFDASNDLGGGGADKNFYLVKEGSGRLRFDVEDSADLSTTARTGTHTFAAGTWVYITATWDLPGDRTEIYVNGVLEDTSTTNVNGAMGDTDTLYLGDNRANNIAGAANYTGNSADGMLDEVRIYNVVLPAWRINQDMNLARPCGADHFKIAHDGFGINCVDETINVSARDPADAVYALYNGSITLDTQSGRGTWVLVSGNGSFNDATADDGLASYTFDPADNGTATFALQYRQGAASFDIDAYETAMPSVRDDDTEGALVFSPSGFTVTTNVLTNPPPDPINDPIGAQTAGTGFTLHIAAYGQTPTDPQCGVIEAYTGAKNLKFWSTYGNPATGTIQATVNGTAVATNEAGAGAQAVNFTNGQAQVTAKYKDVGQIRLDMKDDNVGDPNLPTGIRGGSNNFVVKPARFELSGIARTADNFANPGAADQNGNVFIGAGQPFGMTVTARDAEGDATPNYGQETPAESVALASNLVAPGGGNNPALAFTTGFGPFVNGVTSGTDFRWGEVGIITVTPAVGDGDYLGAGNVTGTASGNIGRFTPDHFDTVRTEACVPGGFTYSGQPFSVTTTAFNAQGGITQNYDSAGAFAKDITISDAGASANFNGTNVIAGASAFTAGVGSVSTIAYTFPVKETPPATLTLRATDEDGVNSNGHNEASSVQRSGRLVFQNAAGSELVDLNLPMRVQYYKDNASGFVTNPDGLCTQVDIDFANYAGSLAPGETCVWDALNKSSEGCATAGPAPEQYQEPPVAGRFNLYLKAPGAGNDGSVDVTADLSALSWLRYDWDGDGAYDDDPRGRATFGIYKGSPRRIYLRERY